MEISILSPEKQLFQGSAKGVILPGTSGYFELLNKHAPIIASLQKGEVKVLGNTPNENKTFAISGGFVECINNHVSVMVEGLL